MDAGDSTSRLIAPEREDDGESQLSYQSLSTATGSWPEPLPDSFELSVAANTSEQQSNSQSNNDDDDADRNDGSVRLESPESSDSRDILHGNNVQNESNPPRKPWTPLALRRTTLLAFTVIFGLILLVLVALYGVSKTEHDRKGISAAKPSSRLLWKYGPTAVFIIINAFWNQTQYRTAQLMPWILMSRGKAASSRSVLLDYITDWNVIVLFRAFKRKDFFVVITITCSLLISGLTVFSTGLFALTSGFTIRDATFTTTHSFNDSGFHPLTVDSEAYAIELGVQLFGMDEPLGTNYNHAYEPFQGGDEVLAINNSHVPDSSYETEVYGLTTELRCENASTSTNDNVIFTVQADTGCVVSHRLESDDMAFDNSTSGIMLHTSIKDCSGEDGEHNKTSFDVGERDWKLWAIVARPRQSSSNRRDDDAPKFNPSQHDLHAVVCEPQLIYGPARVTVRSRPTGRLYGQVQTPPIANNSDGSSSPLRVTGADLLLAAYHSVYSVRKHSRTQDVPYDILLLPNGNIDSYWYSETLKRRLEKSLPSIAAQVAKKYLLQPPGGARVAGTVATSQDRLVVQDLSFGVMLGMLIILISLTLFIVFIYLPVEVCPRDPSSIGGLATILARSPGFEKTLQDMSIAPIPEMDRLLSKQLYQTRTTGDGSFSISQNGRIEQSNGRTNNSSTGIQWWRPFSTRIPVRCAILSLPLALVAVLESLYQHSSKTHGIISIEHTSVARSAWVYVPALVMLCVRALYQTLEFAARVFQPYHSLRQGGASPASSILENQHRKISLYGLISALGRGHWALAAAILPVLLGAFLPVLVSGLYTAGFVVRSEAASVVEYSSWNFTESTDRPYYAAGAPTDAIGGIILHHAIPYPRWTYNDLVFPHVKLSPSVRTSADISTNSIESRLPALRGNLNCKEFPPSDYDVRFNGWGSTRNVMINVSRIDECDIPAFSLAAFTPTVGGYFSHSMELGTMQWQRDPDNGGQWYPQGDNCPTRFYAYGKTPESNTTKDTTSVLGCRPRIELVQADTRLLLDTYDFNTSHPPTVVAGSSQILVDAVLNQSDSSVVDVFPTEHYNKLIWMYRDLGNAEDGTDYLLPNLQTVIYSRGGKSAEELLDPQVLAQELNRVTGVVVAQLLNNWGRELLRIDGSSGDAPTHDARLFVDDTYLVQTATATRLLEAALATMAVSGALAMIFMDTRHVLPKNPCSIAGLGSLLAGSRMLDRDIIPVGAEWRDDKGWKEKGIFVGMTFSLRWWESRGQETVKEGVVVDEAEADEEGSEATGVERTVSANKRFGIDVDAKAEP